MYLGRLLSFPRAPMGAQSADGTQPERALTPGRFGNAGGRREPRETHESEIVGPRSTHQRRCPMIAGYGADAAHHYGTR